MNGTIADIYCPSCGAPARYDIVRQHYHCSYCGGKVEIREALSQKLGFRQMLQENIRRSADQYKLTQASCTGCGADLVFAQGEAATSCAFCGRALVRKEYLNNAELPEMILPFRITAAEAADCLRDWCRRNRRKAESASLEAKAETLQGFYLPYELIRGPVSCQVSRMDSRRSYHCGGYVDNVFVNASKQLDNLLLDAMEPFELDELKTFDFAYTAGQRIKIRDVSEEELKTRISAEVSHDYTPVVQATLETQAVDVNTNPDSVLRLPVLLPVYYLRVGDILAAVNGQTGKVSVRSEQQNRYFFLPWWIKAILATVVISGAALGAFLLFGVAREEALIIAGALAIVTMLVTLCAYSDTVRNKFEVRTGHKIFTSAGGPLRREGEKLVRDPKQIQKEVAPPAFFEELDGQVRPVRLVFSSLPRKLLAGALALTALFLPVIVALFLNGFDFQRLTLGGSAVWFCIMVPVVPIYLLKFSVIERYERPWIYLIAEDGSTSRYRQKRGLKISKETRKKILRALFVPPVSLGVWFGILCFCVMCYLTAFGFD